jgi:predicted lipoprotein with Yx(FWY)xxD motif
MKKLSILLSSAMLAVAGCGDDDDSSNSEPVATTDTAMEKEGDAMKKEGDAMKKEEGDAMKKEGGAMAKGTSITVGESEFGDMLFDANKQAIYIFENDPKGETVCYDDCAEAWPPVLTKGEPVAAKGVDESLLGTVERRDGSTQVTYNDQPLYFYAHEAPGEVRCHNVDLNGGLWWVVGPDGERRP